MDERSITALERLAHAAERMERTALETGSAGPSAQAGSQNTTAAHLPTFAGFNCSWTKDAAGYPSYIITADGSAFFHTKQGDCWWTQSKDGETFRQDPNGSKQARVLPPEAQFRLPDQPEAQPTPPPPPAAAPTQTPASLPPPENDIERPGPHHRTERRAAAAVAAEPKRRTTPTPLARSSRTRLTRLHEIGRKAHGEEQGGEESARSASLPTATDAPRAAADLSHAEAIRLINELAGAVSKSPAYAG